LKSALQKSPIPENNAFVVKALKEVVFDPNWHFHSEYQIFIVLRGSGTMFIGDYIAPFKPGEITMTGPNLPHLWRSDVRLETKENVQCEGIVVYFHDDFLGEKLLQKDEAIKLQLLFKNSSRGIRVRGYTANEIGSMLQNLVHLEGLDSLVALLNILRKFSHCPEIELLASPGYTNTLKEGDTERINQVHTYVMKHFKQKIAISDLANMINMTPTSFSRYFRNHANKTFSEFLSEIRIGYACKLLIEEKVDVSRACYESGFQTISNFNKQFKNITRRTPSAYKREYLQS